MSLDYLDTRPWARKRSWFPVSFAEWVCVRLDALRGQPSGDNLEDWGAGKGDFIGAFRAHGWNCSGYDLLPRLPQVTKADFSEQLPVSVVRRAYADVVVCRNVLEHLNDPTHLLDAIRINMKPDGVACFAVPDWRTYAPIFYSDYTHRRPYDAVSLRDLLATSGFKVMELAEIVQHPWWFESHLAKAYAAFARAVVPLSWGEALSRWTGCEFWRFACLRTVIAFARKGN